MVKLPVLFPTYRRKKKKISGIVQSSSYLNSTAVNGECVVISPVQCHNPAEARCSQKAGLKYNFFGCSWFISLCFFTTVWFHWLTRNHCEWETWHIICSIHEPVPIGCIHSCFGAGQIRLFHTCNSQFSFKFKIMLWKSDYFVLSADVKVCYEESRHRKEEEPGVARIETLILFEH